MSRSFFDNLGNSVLIEKTREIDDIGPSDWVTRLETYDGISPWTQKAVPVGDVGNDDDSALRMRRDLSGFPFAKSLKGGMGDQATPAARGRQWHFQQIEHRLRRQ